MKIADLKKIAENIGRFASVRETARPPSNQIVVQASGGILKVVAGASYGTIIATVHAIEQEFRATLDAREFLTTIKGLPAKKRVLLADLNQGFAVGCSLVDEDTGEVYMDFLRVGKSLPKLMLPPDATALSQGTVALSGPQLEEMGRIFDAVTDQFRPNISVYGKISTHKETAVFSGWDGYKWAESPEYPATYEIFGTIDAEWLYSSRGIGDATMEFWTEGGVTLENNTYRVVGPYAMLSRAAPTKSGEYWTGKLDNVDHQAVVDKGFFVKSVREAAKFDNYGRVGIYLDDNGLKVTTFEAAKHGWLLSGEKILKILSATTVKRIGLGLRNGFGLPISVRVPNWSIELAPVELSKKN